MLYRTDQSSSACRTVSVSTLGRELFLVVSSTGSDQKRRNSSVRNTGPLKVLLTKTIRDFWCRIFYRRNATSDPSTSVKALNLHHTSSVMIRIRKSLSTTKSIYFKTCVCSNIHVSASLWPAISDIYKTECCSRTYHATEIYTNINVRTLV